VTKVVLTFIFLFVCLSLKIFISYPKIDEKSDKVYDNLLP